MRPLPPLDWVSMVDFMPVSSARWRSPAIALGAFPLADGTAVARVTYLVATREFYASIPTAGGQRRYALLDAWDVTPATPADVRGIIGDWEQIPTLERLRQIIVSA